MKLFATVSIICGVFFVCPLRAQWTGTYPGPISYTGGNVGIGATQPIAGLTVSQDGQALFAPYNIVQDARIHTGANGALVFDTGASGTYNLRALEFDFQSTDLRFGRYDSTQANSPIWDMTVASNGNVGIGTTTPTDMLDVAGTIAAQQIKVEASVPDYVFEPSYHLQPLSEVKQFVEEHHHLPDIPSASEVKEKGLNIGDMEAKLLGKIEELTLHMIQAEERNSRLEERNDLLEKQVRGLQERLAQLAPATGNTESK